MPPKKSKKKKTKRVKKVAEIPTAPEAELPDLAQYQNLPIPQDENERIELANQLKTGGNRYYAAAEYEKAIELYSKSISLHQAYKTFGNRSAAYLKVGKYNDAVADASFCTKNRAQWVKGWQRLGDANLAASRHERAITAFKEGLLLEPTNEKLKSSMATAVSSFQSYENAKKAAEERKTDASNDPAETTVIGIDLGTTYSCAAVWKGDSVRIIPNSEGQRTTASVVSFKGNERVVGNVAKAQGASNPLNTVFDVKRIIGQDFDSAQVKDDVAHMPFTVVAGSAGQPLVEVDYMGERKQLAPEEISAMVLGKMKEIAEEYLGHEVKKAVITVPAYFNDAQRAATKNAGAIAGLQVMRIINEPTAAALAYGLDLQKESGASGQARQVLVFDLGGGTFDVSLLTIEGGIFTVIATAGDTHLGGDDFDNVLVDHVLTLIAEAHPGSDVKGNPRAMKRVRQKCEDLKRELSVTASAVIEIPALLEGVDFTCELNRETFNTLNENLFVKCIDVVKKVMADAKSKTEDITDVVLVGGSTRIPKVQEMLKTYLNKDTLCKTINPDEAVAYGAAVQGAILSGARNSATNNLLLVDVTPLSLGIETTGRVMSNIISRNTPIPVRRTKTYTTESDFQTEVDVTIYEGERQCVDGNNLLGDFRITGIERAKRGEPQVDVTFDIDANGMLTVTACDQTTGAEANVVISNERGRLSDADIERMLADAAHYKEQDAAQVARIEAKNRLENLLYQLMESSKRRGNQSALRTCMGIRDWLDTNPNPTEGECELRELELNQL